jgi:hypothetical protein
MTCAGPSCRRNNPFFAPNYASSIRVRVRNRTSGPELGLILHPTEQPAELVRSSTGPSSNLWRTLSSSAVRQAARRARPARSDLR